MMSRVKAIVLVLVLTCVLAGTVLPELVPTQESIGIRLTDVAQAAGVTVLNVSGEQKKDFLLEVVGNGAAWFDYNNDGLMDLLVVNGATLEHLKTGGDPIATLYKNNGDGTFTDVTAKSGLLARGWGMGVCVADYDNNGTEDVYITGFGSSHLFRNNGDGTFTNVSAAAGAGVTGWSTGCAFGDYDRDGYVDLYVARYVAFDPEKTPRPSQGSFCQYMGMDVLCGPRGLRGEPDVLLHNNRNGMFSDVTEQAGIHDPGYYGLGVVFSDLDNNGWPDIYVANDSTPNFLFRNNKDGTFTEIGLEAGAALSEAGAAQAGMGVDVGDYKHDGNFAIFVTNFSQDYNTLYENGGKATFRDVSYPTGLAGPSLPYMGWGTGFVDLANGGFLDLFVANGHIYPQIDQYALGSKFLERKQLFHNQGDGHFRDVTDEIGGGVLIEKSSRGVAFGDCDNDGDMDILIVNLNDRPTLLRNDGGNRKHWVTLRLVGTKSNRDAIGARVRITAGRLVQTAEVRSGGSFMSNNDIRLHFGLGQETRIQSLEVRWPSGLVEKSEDLRADQFLRITEGQGILVLDVPKAIPKY
ncbi:MAG: hypothetical protein DMG35_18710 [Acidobacteria bacterium]|nr:MAG: hypothetical protein DMG35_18710 [Acidobacteriota bacterium]